MMVLKKAMSRRTVLRGWARPWPRMGRTSSKRRNLRSPPMRTIAALSPFACVAFLLIACDGDVVIGANQGKLMKNLDGSPTGDGSTCTYAGETVTVGQPITADSCNDCKCTAQGALCTAKACASDGGTGGTGTCFYDGKTYKVGDSFKSTDGCNSCFCSSDNLIGCTEMACATPPPTDCTAKGACSDPMPGVPSIQCADGTTAGPECSDLGGQCGWHITSCVCKEGTVVHHAGDNWSDGCNTCSCSQNGQAMCTQKACACPPDGTTIDCMPPIDQKPMCSGAYHDFIVASWARTCSSARIISAT